MNFFRDRKMNSCLLKRKYRQRLSYGEQLLKEQYSTAVVSLKIVNLIIAWLLDIELYMKLKAGLIISTKNTNWFAVLQIWRLIQLLSLKKEQKNILKIHQEKGQHYYQLYLIDCSVGIMIKKIIKKIQYLTMNCSRCL